MSEQEERRKEEFIKVRSISDKIEKMKGGRKKNEMRRRKVRKERGRKEGKKKRN